MAREEALLHFLLDVTRRFSTCDLVKELCAFGIWPLAREWSVELGVSRSEHPTLSMKGCEGMILGSALLIFHVDVDWANLFIYYYF